jgi:hypothetical protein
MNVHLPHHVANAPDIEFLRPEIIVNKQRNPTDQAHHLSITPLVKLMQILNPISDLGHDQNPRKRGLILKQNPAAIDPAQLKPSRRQARMQLEFHMEMKNHDSAAVNPNIPIFRLLESKSRLFWIP